jgi:hypothetical protein
MSDTPGANKPPRSGGFLGSLKDALAAASRDDTGRVGSPAMPAPTPAAQPTPSETTPSPDPVASAPLASRPAADPAPTPVPSSLSAAEAAREARGVTSLKLSEKPDFDGTNTTRFVRVPKPTDQPGARDMAAPNDDHHAGEDAAPARTQLVRGRQALKAGQFTTDPVVGWLVVVMGPGLGSFRPVFEGNNTIGRSTMNRIALDFGDEAISAEEQAYIRYDSTDRSFLLVPNMSKTNVVSHNNNRPTTAVPLKAMDVVTMGKTRLVFVPFCGPEFDWSEIKETKD